MCTNFSEETGRNFSPQMKTFPFSVSAMHTFETPVKKHDCPLDFALRLFTRDNQADRNTAKQTASDRCFSSLPFSFEGVPKTGPTCCAGLCSACSPHTAHSRSDGGAPFSYLAICYGGLSVGYPSSAHLGSDTLSPCLRPSMASRNLRTNSPTIWGGCCNYFQKSTVHRLYGGRHFWAIPPKYLKTRGELKETPGGQN